MVFNNLNVGLIESEIVLADKESNLKQLSDGIKSLPRSIDIAIVPELFSTGYISDINQATALAERNTESTMNGVHDIAKQNSCAICGSFLAHTAAQIYNRAFFAEPSGDDTFYDKYHVFSIGGENEVFTAGSKQSPIIRFRGWNIKVVICYDLRFPVFCRNKGNEYDVLIVVGNWPTSRIHSWKSLLIARAIENQCYVCAVNRCGTDENGLEFSCGTSFVIDYKGDIIAETNSGKQITAATLAMDKLNNFRRKFPAWKDADAFELR